MRILSLSFAVAALALAFTPAVVAQENTSRVRQAYLRMQARQQEVRHKERVMAKAQEWAARKAAQNKRDAWIAEHAPQIAASQRAGSGQAQQVRAVRGFIGDPALNAEDQVRRPRTRQMIKAQREQIEARRAGQSDQVLRPNKSNAAKAAGARSNAAKVVRPKVQRHQAQSSQAPSRNPSKVEAPRRAVRSAGGRAMRSADQPRSGGAVRSQGGRGGR